MAVVNPEIDYVAADAETDMPTPSDMAREQMSSMGLNAPSILSSRNETRTEEEIAADRQTLAEVAPGTGDILAVKNYPEDMSTAKETISQGLDKGELSSVLGGVALAGLATVGLLPSVTGVGAGAKVAKKAVKENLKKNLVKEFGDDGASKVVDTVGEASQPVKVIGVKPPKKTVKAYKLFKKDKNGNLYPLFVKMQGNKPLELNTWTKAEAGEINTKTGKVKSSLGDLAYRPGFHGGDLPIATHIGGKKGKVSKPNYRKDNQVWAEVEFGDDTDWQSIANSRALVNKDGTTRVSTAHITDQIPEGGFYRYKTNPNMTGNWLIGGELKINRILTNDEVKSINDAAGVADLPRLSELNMAEGGAVPMKEQMSMFEDGGLLDEGGSIDPVSGNDVPPGSTQEEVRDDIPAQLSEGEFVFPADVVRYFGLETLMKMRQEAKAGLQRMEDMGQMGNSDEAIIPDNLPFDINDLDMEDDGVVEFADGGVVQAQQGTYVLPQTGVNTNTGVYYTPSQAQPTGYAAPKPVEAASSQYERPVQQDVPVMAGPGTPGYQTPRYEDFIKPVEGTAPELREYINTKTGEKMMITFINGQPTVPIPEGFVPASEYVAPETVASQTSKVKTTRQVDEPAGREEIEKEEAMYGPGGGRVSLGGNLNPDRPGTVTGATQFGVSFNNMGGLPGVTGTAMTTLGLATGKGIPENATATITRDGVSVTIPATDYNKMKEENFRGETSDAVINKWQQEKNEVNKQKELRDYKQQALEELAAKTAEEIKAEKAEQDRQMRAAFSNVADPSGDGAGGSMDTSFDTSGGEGGGESVGSPSGPTGSQSEVDSFESDLG
jgi:hypothetical protein